MNNNLEKQFNKLIRNNIHNDSFNTRKTYKQRFSQFLEFCSERGVQSIHKIKNKTVADYINIQLDNGVSETTLKATAAAIRYFIKMACEMKNVEPKFNLNNNQLGIASKKEFLYKDGISKTEYDKACSMALNKDDMITYDALRLGYILGLRSNEIFNLRVYQLRDAINSCDMQFGRIEISFGTKGGKKRTALFDVRHIAELKEIYSRAKKSNKRMTDKVMTGNEKDDCKKSLTYWHNWWSRNAMAISAECNPNREAPLSAHCLRRQYARSLFDMLLGQGMPKQKAADIVSDSLGHGKASTRKDITSIYLGFRV